MCFEDSHEALLNITLCCQAAPPPRGVMLVVTYSLLGLLLCQLLFLILTLRA